MKKCIGRFSKKFRSNKTQQLKGDVSEMNPEEKLQLYEKMQKAVETEYDTISAQMETLKAEGKTKTVTYKTLFGKKVMYKNMLSMYEVYGLMEK